VAKVAIAVLSCVLFACGPRAAGSGDGGGSNDDGSVGLHVLTAIEVTPTNPIIELDLNQPGMQGFAAMGRFQDGNDMDISDRVNWSVVNPAVGTLSGTTLNIPGFATTTVEVSRIRAELDGIIGEAQITVVAYRRSGPSQDFFFVLPYMPPTGEVAKPLDFGTAVPALDVFFLMDTTFSMLGEIQNLQSALTNTVIPGVQNAVANSMFGVGAFEDFPVLPHGGPRSECGVSGSTLDQPLSVFSNMTNVAAQLQAAVAQYTVGGQPKGCGASWPESAIEAMYLVATGQGVNSPGGTNVPASNIGFRPKTMPVIVTITDAISNAAGEARTCSTLDGGSAVTGYGSSIATAHTRQQAKDALRAKCARTVGIAPVIPLIGNCSAEADLEDFATATGARVPPNAWDIGGRPAGCSANQCCTGINGVGRAPDGNGLCPLVFRVNDAGAGVSTNVVTGIQLLTRFAQFDVTSERQGVTTDIDGNALPAPHTTADFIKAVTPTGFMLPPAPPVVPNPTFDATTFYGVTPSTRVQFDVRALNDFVMQTTDAQIFRATIRVVASGCSDLDQRDVLILVPPTPIVIQ
jgi:hypothetical protein